MSVSTQGSEPRAIEPTHDRWESALWSSVVVGLGQIRNGQRALGLGFLAGFAVCFLIGVASLSTLAVPIALGLIAATAMLTLYGLSIVQAFLYARTAGDDAQPPPAYKAVFLTRFVPGLGQIVERRFLPGFLALAAYVIADLIGGVVALSPVVVFTNLDALTGSRRRKPSRARAWLITFATMLPLLLALSATVALRRSVVQAFRMPGEAMLPTIRAGDFFTVDRSRAGRAARGEIIAYRFPPKPAQQFVKRCVAVGGESVEIRNKQLLVDGQPVTEPYVVRIDPTVRPAGFDPRDNFGPIVVPRGSVFVLGDNRDNSNDSRFWGTLPERDILGRAVKIYWPPGRWGSPLR